MTASVVRVFVDILVEVAEKYGFFAIFCFMPDHLHLILLAANDEADVLRGVERYKQATGYWISKNSSRTKWQKSFNDRILRRTELGVCVRYVLDNPVRRNLVGNWRDYPFTGAVGIDLEQLVQDLA